MRPDLRSASPRAIGQCWAGHTWGLKLEDCCPQHPTLAECCAPPQNSSSLLHPAQDIDIMHICMILTCVLQCEALQGLPSRGTTFWHCLIRVWVSTGAASLEGPLWAGARGAEWPKAARAFGSRRLGQQVLGAAGAGSSRGLGQQGLGAAGARGRRGWGQQGLGAEGAGDLGSRGLGHAKL